MALALHLLSASALLRPPHASCHLTPLRPSRLKRCAAALMSDDRVMVEALKQHVLSVADVNPGFAAWLKAEEWRSTASPAAVPAPAPAADVAPASPAGRKGGPVEGRWPAWWDKAAVAEANPAFAAWLSSEQSAEPMASGPAMAAPEPPTAEPQVATAAADVPADVEAAVAAQGAEVRRLKEEEGLTKKDPRLSEAVAELLRLTLLPQ